VTGPVWLIAGREFRAYAATASFWVALAVGPLVLAGVMALSAANRSAPPAAVKVESADPALATSAIAALGEAARIEGRRYGSARPGRPAATLVLDRSADGGLEARFSAGFPLSAVGRALVERTVERDLLAQRLPPSGVATHPQVRDVTPRPPLPADAGALSRFCLVMMLWLTLTGSLGMLLQAVVRERANRALEGLLAAARPWEVVAGKLIGVGAVSMLVLAVWLGSAAALAILTSGGDGLLAAVLAGLGAPAALARATLLYLLAFGFYGLVTVALGASARDSAAAQNLARPMFVVLLVAFFAALTAVSGAAGHLAWLAYAPPFTPFILLLEPPSAFALGAQIWAVALLLAATLLAGRMAVARVTLTGAADRPYKQPTRSPTS
jgi:ABC-2 type transport system permease protein